MKKLKWPLMAVSWILLCSANTVDDGWAQEILFSLATIGFVGTIAIYVME